MGARGANLNFVEGLLNGAAFADELLVNHALIFKTVCKTHPIIVGDWFAEVVASELKPLLEEYWFDAPEEAERQAASLLEGW